MPRRGPQSVSDKHNIAVELNALRGELQRIAHEIRLRIVEADAETTKAWNRFETELQRFELRARQATGHTRLLLEHMGTDLKQRLGSFRTRMLRPPVKQVSTLNQA